MADYVCAICGKAIKDAARYTKYCSSECSQKGKLLVQNEYRKKIKEEKKIKAKEDSRLFKEEMDEWRRVNRRKSKKVSVSLSEAEKIAERYGLSYGKMQAKLYCLGLSWDECDKIADRERFLREERLKRR